jgi:hypothetical protein
MSRKKPLTIHQARGIAESRRKDVAKLRDAMRNELQELEALVDSLSEAELNLSDARDSFDDAITEMSKYA